MNSLDTLRKNNQPDDPSELDDILENLMSFDLSRLEARVYAFLIASGGCRASQVATRLGINRVDIYRVLRGLANRGLIDIVMDYPRVYRAVEPRALLKILLSAAQERFQSIKAKAADLIVLLESSENRSDPNRSTMGQRHSSTIAIEKGRAIYTKIVELLEQAEGDVFAAWGGEPLRRAFAEGILECCVRCLNRGVRVRILTEVTRRNLPEAEEFAQVAECRHLDNFSVFLRYIVIDGIDVVLSLEPDFRPISEQVCLWVRNKTLATALKLEFEKNWNHAVEFGRMVPNLVRGT
jgi:sugar-specific transcriptional regulator TrmB